jgi:hypothetical protein
MMSKFKPGDLLQDNIEEENEIVMVLKSGVKNTKVFVISSTLNEGTGSEYQRGNIINVATCSLNYWIKLNDV